MKGASTRLLDALYRISVAVHRQTSLSITYGVSSDFTYHHSAMRVVASDGKRPTLKSGTSLGTSCQAKL